MNYISEKKVFHKAQNMFSRAKITFLGVVISFVFPLT